MSAYLFDTASTVRVARLYAARCPQFAKPEDGGGADIVGVASALRFLNNQAMITRYQDKFEPEPLHEVSAFLSDPLFVPTESTADFVKRFAYQCNEFETKPSYPGQVILDRLLATFQEPA